MASVTLQNVEKDYGSLRILHGVDLEIADGEFVVLVGPSGCGKSTLLRMIAGLEDLSDGDLSIGGQLMNDLPAAQRDVGRRGWRRQPLVQETRQLGQRFDERCRFGEQAPLQRAKADLVLHPPFEEWLRRHPQVEIRVELPAEPFDVEKRLLQQHQLRLNFDLETP